MDEGMTISSRASGPRSVSRRVAIATSVTSLFAGMLIAGPIAFATASSSATTYYACLHNGVLSKVGTAKPTCPSGSKLISWNSAGPQGTAGPGAAYFTSSGTYKVPAGVTELQITVTGAGGGGGGDDEPGLYNGGGGGQGGTATVVSDVTAGQRLTVVVGVGGVAGVNDVDACGAGGAAGGAGGRSSVASGPAFNAPVFAYALGGGGGGLPCDGASSGPGQGGAGGAVGVISGETTLSEAAGADGTTVTEGGKAKDPGVGGGVAGVNGSGGEGGLTVGAVNPVAGSNGFVEIIPN